MTYNDEFLTPFTSDFEDDMVGDEEEGEDGETKTPGGDEEEGDGFGTGDEF
jgi:hypothetical protein